MRWTKKKEDRLFTLGQEIESGKLTWENVASLMETDFSGSEFTAEQVRKKFARIQKKIIKQKGEKQNTELEKTLLRLLKRGPIDVIELANKLGIAPQEVKKKIEELGHHGYNILDTQELEQYTLVRTAYPPSSKVKQFEKPNIKLGIISDLHICSKYFRPDILDNLYDTFESEGVKEVYVCGNVVDGEKTYKGHEYEITVMGAENQAKSFAEALPRKKGITTHFIASSSCHEGYYFKSAGLLWGYLVTHPDKEWYREDINYLGLDEVNIIIENEQNNGRIIMRLIHPSGGTAYAFSYKPQKIVTSYEGGHKPNILCIGHYHKTSYNMIRNVHVIQAGCVQDQTPFMRKKAIPAHKGGWIIEFNITDDNSVTRFRPELIHYFK